MPSKIIIGKSFHERGFQRPPVRWWVESFIQQLEKDLPQVSTALPLGGGLKGLRRWPYTGQAKKFPQPYR
ncbi:MAG: hypothetical protein FWK04_18220 [Nostoc sp. GBBB01]|nr:hypothetical protein [Nostoc sp. GBBB01]